MPNLTFEEAHNLEIELENTLRKKRPESPALKYYGSTWKAIDAYYEALYGHKFFEEEVGKSPGRPKGERRQALSELEEIQLRLAMLEKECPNCHGTGKDNIFVCSTCGGTGKVPLLEGVREKCPAINHPLDLRCSFCDNRGWVPSKDPFKYLQAADKVILAQHEHMGGSVKSLIDIHIWEGELSTFRALESALVKLAKVG